MAGTFWAFVPAIIAIVLALLTKQVYLSLFAGIFVGAMFISNGNPIQALGELFTVMADKLGGNATILVFLVMLGILVILMTKSGGSKAYGDWAATKIKTRKGALAATAGLGCLIFVDDYFNCLTVGSVMRPLTDKFNVSRSKLAYLIDSTAAPICIIAPISSWAAAVSGELEGDGLIVFIKTIPLNLYAILTIAMVAVVCFTKFDLFKMRKNEKIALETGDLHAGETDLPVEETADVKISEKGRVAYLLVPILVLIATCVGSMIYVGYFYDWDAGVLGTTVQSSNVIEAISNCDAGLSLSIGSTITVIFTMIYYAIVRVVSFKDMMESIAQGFKSMVPAILILTFAWTLSGIMGAKGGELDARAFVEAHLTADSMAIGVFPVVFFLVAAGVSFATGTSWGTFGILIPITTAVLGTEPNAITLLSVSACLAGAVYGDHVSPISDTTILASSGAQCNHVDHVKTQLPYATLVAIIAALGYLISGFIAVKASYGVTIVATLGISAVVFAGAIVGAMFLQKKFVKEEPAQEAEAAQQE